MADNVSITAGTGTTVHADEYTHATLGAGKTQLVKLVDGTLDSGTAIAAGGGVEAGALRVTVASDSTGVLSVDDNGGALTVDGSVTVNAGTNLNTSALALEAGGNLAAIKAKTDNIPALGQALAAASVPVILPAATVTTLTPPAAITGFATEAKQLPDGHSVALSATDNAVLDAIEADTTTLAGAVAGTEMQVDVLTMPTVTVNSHAVTNAGTFAVQAAATLAAETTKVIGTVNIAAAQTVGLAAGTAGIGKLTANSGVDIGDVDILSIAAGNNNIGDVDVASIAAGTNAIGKLLPPDVDVTAHTNYARKYYTSAGAATDGIIWSPAAGKRWHVVTLYLQTSAAATITLEDDKAGGDDPVWKAELAANSGVVLSFTEKYPMASGEDAADLLVTTSAGNVYITCVGYEI